MAVALADHVLPERSGRPGRRHADHAIQQQVDLLN